MPATVRQYELVYIVRADLSDEQLQAVIAKYDGIITSQGGTLERTDVWERRRLAYEIKGQTEGVYIVTVFRSLPHVEAELRRVFRISEDTLRSMIVKPDEEIDASIPSVAPREIAPRQPYGYHSHGASAPASAVAQANAAAEAEAKRVAAEAGENAENAESPSAKADEPAEEAAPEEAGEIEEQVEA